jgi:hypothetical protein
MENVPDSSANPLATQNATPSVQTSPLSSVASNATDPAVNSNGFIITTHNGSPLSNVPQAKAPAIPQAEIDAARAKLTPEEQNFYDWRLEQIDPMQHRRVGDIFAEQGANIYSDPTAAREAMARRPTGEWTDPQWREKLAAQNAARLAEQNYAKQNPGPFVVGGGNAQEMSSASQAVPAKIQQDYQSFFDTTKPGSYTDFAGGVLYRAPNDETALDYQGKPVNQSRAIFYAPNGKEYTLTDKTDLNAIAYTIPEIAQAWKDQYGFTPTGQAPASGVMTADNWNPINQVYADAKRDPYASDRDMVFDKQLRAVDLTGYKNSRQGAFEKLAMDVYGGKNMTTQDISRLNDAVGGVGAYIPDPENPGKYKLTYADDISKSPYAPKNVPTAGYSFDQLVALQNNGQATGNTQQSQQQYSPLSVISKMNTDAQAYWDSQPTGSTFEVAGGTLTRVNDNQSIFTSASGKRSVMNRQDAFNTIADRIPEFAQAWKENYGYDASASEASLRSDFDRSFQKDPIAFLSQLGIGNFTLDEVNGKKYLADYKSGQMIPMEALTSIENLGRYIGDARSKVESVYGYEGTPLGDVWSQLNSPDWRFSSADPIRAEDPLFKNVDFEPYRNVPAGAFYAIADQVYGGKNMSFEDIARIQEETGSVGAYVPDPQNPGKYMVDRARANIPKSAFDSVDSYLNDYYETKKIEQAPVVDANELYKKFGVTDAKATPTSEGILAGFKYAKDSGISDASLKKSLGTDVYNTYQKGFSDYAKTGIANIISDGKLSFDEAQEIHNLGRDLGFKPEDLARITGQDKSVFELANTNYVKGRDQIINGTLNDTKLTTDADKIISAVALQNEFKFTDEDFAQATGKDIKDIKAVLDPVRNFETDFTGLFQNTDTTTGDAKSFVEKARGNAAINKLYGESLNEVETNIKRLEEKWRPYGSDALQTETLARQLTAQRDALGGEYYKGIYGDLNSSAAQLNKKGLDTIKDLGQKDKFQTQDVVTQNVTADGKFAQAMEDGSFAVWNSDGENGSWTSIPKDQVKTIYGKSVIESYGDSSYTAFQPLSEQELATVKNGTYQEKIGTVVIDKDTGKELTGTDGVLLYDKTGPWYKEYKNYLNAQFTADGTPILTASREKAGLYGFVSDVTPMVLAVASWIPGPHQPFAKLASAALALEQKNYIGAVLSGFSAAGSFAGNELATLQAAEAAGDIIDASRVLELKDTVSNIKLATTFVQGAAALDAGNIPGLINAGLSGYTQLNDTPLPSGVTTSLQLGNLAVSLSNKQYDQALNALGDLTGSSDAKLAGAAATLVSAIQKAGETGDYSGVVNAGFGLAEVVKAGPSSSNTDGGITNRVVDDAIPQGEAGSSAFIAAKNAGASDEDAMAAADAATGVVVNKVADAGPNTSVIAGPVADVADKEFGDLQGAISKNDTGDTFRSDKLDVISNAPKFSDAYRQARELLGAGKTFEWNGKTYSTDTRAENPVIAAASDATRLNNIATSTTAGGGRGSYLGYSSAEDAASKANLTVPKTNELLGYINDDQGGGYDALGNPIGGQTIGASADLSTTSGKIANGVANAMNTFLGVVANTPVDAVRAGGNLLSNAGGIVDLVAGKSTDVGNKLRSLSDQVESFTTSISDPKIKTQQQAIGSAIDKADGLTGKTEALLSSAWDNPLGAASWVFTEGFEEVPGVGLALKAGSKLGTYGIAIANDMMESGGAAYNDTYKAAITQGMPEADARVAARNSSLAAMAVTGVTQGVVEGKLLTNAVGKNTAGEFAEGSLQAGATQLALGQDLSVDKMLTQGVIEAGVGKGASSTANAVTATNIGAGTESGASGAAAGLGAVGAVAPGGTSTGTTTGTTNLGSVGAATPGADVVTGTDLGAIGNVTPGGDAVAGDTSILGGADLNAADASQSTISVGDAQQTMADLGLNVSDDVAIDLAAKIGNANNSGNDVSITSDANTVTISDATSNTKTIVDANTNTTTTVDGNANTTTQTVVDASKNTQTTVVADANNNTNTQTVVDSNTNVTTSITIDGGTDTVTQTTIDANTKTQTTVITDVNTNSQITVKVNTETGDVIEEKETVVPDGWKPPVIDSPKIPESSTSTSTSSSTPATKSTPAAKLGASGSGAAIAGGAAGLPSGFDMDPASLGSKVTQGKIDPLARVKEAQAELERDVMMNQIDPRLLSVMQQRMDPNQQAKQLEQDVGALAKLLSGESPDPSAPASNEGKYYSYGSEDSIDDILGGKTPSYKEGGFVEPLKASGGMVLPLLAKSGGALGKYNGREDFKGGKHVAGEGDGQSDDIPAWLADGEFVFPADVVSALGNGSTKAGTDKLYEMMHGIRDRARSKGPKDLPPPALKSALDYLKSSKRSSK